MQGDNDSLQLPDSHVQPGPAITLSSITWRSTQHCNDYGRTVTSDSFKCMFFNEKCFTFNFNCTGVYSFCSTWKYVGQVMAWWQLAIAWTSTYKVLLRYNDLSIIHAHTDTRPKLGLCIATKLQIIFDTIFGIDTLGPPDAYVSVKGAIIVSGNGWSHMWCSNHCMK